MGAALYEYDSQVPFAGDQDAVGWLGPGSQVDVLGWVGLGKLR
jgi:hypothetical protein